MPIMFKTQKRKAEGTNLRHTSHCSLLKNVGYLFCVVRLVFNLEVRALFHVEVASWIRFIFFNLFLKSGDAQGGKSQGHSHGWSNLISLLFNVSMLSTSSIERSQILVRIHQPLCQNISKLFLFQNHPT